MKSNKSNMVSILKLNTLMLTTMCGIAACNTGTNSATNQANTSTSGFNQTNKATNVNSKNNSHIYTLGGTFDTTSIHPTANKTCLNIGNNLNDIQLTNPQASFSFGEMVVPSQVTMALDSAFASGFGWGPYETHPSYAYATSSQDDDFTMNMNYISQYVAKASFKPGTFVTGKSALTPVALSALESSPEQFRAACGDSFIGEIDAGISVLMRVNLRFNSPTEKDIYTSSFHDKGGLSNILNDLENNTSGITPTLSIAGIQVGGDPQQLNNLFIANGGQVNSDGYPVLNCQIESNNVISASCNNIIIQVINYAKHVADQLHSFDDYYLYNPTLGEWLEAGINPGTTPSNGQAVDAWYSIFRQFNDDSTKLEFLNNYSHMLGSYHMLSTKMNSDLSNLINQYNQVLNVYYNPANLLSNCYSGYITNQCLTIRDNIFNQRNNILNDTHLNNLLTYLQTQQYTASLLASNTTPYDNMQYCAFSPISDDSTNQYMINCGDYISGSFDSAIATTITKDPRANVLHLSNLNYVYPSAGAGSPLLNFSYLTSSGLLPDSSNSWSSDVMVKVNGSNYGVEELNLVEASSN